MGAVVAEGFHGFHIHANDKPENGVGCVADPSAASSTWFVSAEGHLSDVGATHGHHNGDIPSVLVNKDGSADLAFTTGRLSVGDLENRVVPHRSHDDRTDRSDRQGSGPLAVAACRHRNSRPSRRRPPSARISRRRGWRGPS